MLEGQPACLPNLGPLEGLQIDFYPSLLAWLAFLLLAAVTGVLLDQPDRMDQRIGPEGT